MKKGDIIDLYIDSMAFGGEGVGKYLYEEKNPRERKHHEEKNPRERKHHEEKNPRERKHHEEKDPHESRLFTVFVRGAVPKDKVRVKITGKKRNYARAQIVDFIEKAKNRITPKCPHFLLCGGCSLQDLPYEDQLLIKEQQVKDSMTRIGNLDENVVLPIIGCEKIWHYRNKMEFSFDIKDGDLHLGMHLKGRFHDVADIEECFLFDLEPSDLVIKMRDFFKNFPSKNLKSLLVRKGVNTGEILIALVTENMETTTDPVKEFSAFSQKFGFESVYHINHVNRQGQKKISQENLLWGNKVIMEKLKLQSGDELNFEISPQSFFQPNTIQAQNLYSIALTHAKLKKTDVLYDLYCGTGTIALCASKSAGEIFGVDINDAAIQNAVINAGLNNISNVKFLSGDCAQAVSKIPKPADAVIIDPPRNGLGGGAFSVIAGIDAPRVVYISCNPTTLARDLNLFTKTGYKTELVQPVDMFPQTYHIECVAVLSR